MHIKRLYVRDDLLTADLRYIKAARYLDALLEASLAANTCSRNSAPENAWFLFPEILSQLPYVFYKTGCFPISRDECAQLRCN